MCYKEGLRTLFIFHSQTSAENPIIGEQDYLIRQHLEE